MTSRFVSMLALVACLAPSGAVASGRSWPERPMTAISSGHLPPAKRLRAPAHKPSSIRCGPYPAAQRAGIVRMVMPAPEVMPAPAAVAPHDESPVLVTGRIRVIDGDTFAIGRERFRLRGIDTPERGQANWLTATLRLDALLHGTPVTLVRHGTDVYGRTLVDVYAAGADVALILRREGFDTRR